MWVGFPERSRGAREGARDPRNVRPDDRRRIKAVSFEIRGVRFFWLCHASGPSRSLP